ncbi:NAD(P)-binding domain-containing protein [Streptomyces sp. NPDC048442]|uniref:NADPH-dependent F420 reductase n=1 Tax=Streptomyces sp. NPDC048442 TaxID=3154823 RepID=UPI0034174836
MSNISIIGTGDMARTIGARATAGGNTVEIMGRDQSKAADLAKALGGGATTGEWGTAPAGDIVIVALLHDGVVPVIARYGDALAGKVIVDISNPFNSTFDGLAHREETSIAQAKASVEAFIESLGMRPLDVGGLKMAHWLEGAGVVTVGLANHGVGNLNFALSITELPV